MSLAWVRSAVHRSLGFEPYPGTLNVRLADPDMRSRWREVSKQGALLPTPPPPETRGGRLVSDPRPRGVPGGRHAPRVHRDAGERLGGGSAAPPEGRPRAEARGEAGPRQLDGEDPGDGAAEGAGRPQDHGLTQPLKAARAERAGNDDEPGGDGEERHRPARHSHLIDHPPEPFQDVTQRDGGD